jgi:hypothetical protein
MRDILLEMFSDEEKVLEHCKIMYAFLLLGMMGDSISSNISGVLRAIGKEHLASSMFLILYVLGG